MHTYYTILEKYCKLEKWYKFISKTGVELIILTKPGENRQKFGEYSLFFRFIHKKTVIPEAD